MIFADWAVKYGLLHSVELRLGVALYWHDQEAALPSSVWLRISSIGLLRHMKANRRTSRLHTMFLSINVSAPGTMTIHRVWFRGSLCFINVLEDPTILMIQLTEQRSDGAN